MPDLRKTISTLWLQNNYSYMLLFFWILFLIPELENENKFLVLGSLLLITFLLLFERDLDFSIELLGEYPLFLVNLIAPAFKLSTDLAFFLLTNFRLVLFDL